MKLVDLPLSPEPLESTLDPPKSTDVGSGDSGNKTPWQQPSQMPSHVCRQDDGVIPLREQTPPGSSSDLPVQMHISEKLAASQSAGRPTFSFEFFPPKTAQVRPPWQRLPLRRCADVGLSRVCKTSTTVGDPLQTAAAAAAAAADVPLDLAYSRPGMNRMHGLGPAFIDVTWGAGGRLSDLTCEMVNVAQSAHGLETCMHLTCTDMERSKVDWALKEAYRAGCTNILALRGDPPREKEKWTATQGGFMYAKDLVHYIRDRYGNHFDIGVAGYPEGCDDQDDRVLLMDHLKEKVDAGATFVVTQMFYDVDIFLDWVRQCRKRGITVPIIPGIMPIHTYAAFLRRATWTKCRIPPEWTEALEPVKNDDAAVREVGKVLVAEMCRRMLDAGILHLHLYVSLEAPFPPPPPPPFFFFPETLTLAGLIRP